MTYLYEQLGDEKFQQLAQAILVDQFPDAQCFPVGQPDGGRDAFAWDQLRNPKKEAVIFQVKFSRNPSDKDERTAIESLIESEAAKVEELRMRVT